MDTLARMCFVSLIAASACTPSIKVDTSSEEPCCEELDEPPLMLCEEIPDGQVIGEDVPVQCTVTDADGVFMVTINYASETSSFWQDAALRPADASGLWTGEIPRDDVTGAGMYYYFGAVDENDDQALYPDGGEDEHLHFRISVD